MSRLFGKQTQTSVYVCNCQIMKRHEVTRQSKWCVTLSQANVHCVLHFHQVSFVQCCRALHSVTGSGTKVHYTFTLLKNSHVISCATQTCLHALQYMLRELTMMKTIVKMWEKDFTSKKQQANLKQVWGSSVETDTTRILVTWFPQKELYVIL